MGGLFETSDWGPLGVGLVLVAGGLAVRGGLRLTPAARVAGVSLVGLAAWSQMSLLWAESADAALVDAGRWSLFAALFLLLASLTWDERNARAVIVGLGGGIVAIAAFDVAILLLGETEGRFFERRLEAPLGYANAQAAYFLIGLCPALALADRARSIAGSAAAAGGVALLVGLVLVIQPRSALIALGATVLVVLCLPGGWRRAAILGVVAVALAPVAPGLLDLVGSQKVDVPVSVEDARAAGARLVIAALAAAALWACVELGWEFLTTRRGLTAASARRVGMFALALGAAVLVVGATVHAPRIATAVKDGVDDFTELRPQSERGSRLLTTSGNRYDYWRVALAEFGEHPLAGQGAGNYRVEYYLRRRTEEAVTQPHSLALQTLAELGIVGGALLAAWIAALGVGLSRRMSGAASDPWTQALTVAGAGGLTVWFVHAQFDWLHLFPGLAGAALACAAILVAPVGDEVRPKRRTGTKRRALVAAYVLLTLIAIVQVTRTTAAAMLRNDARDALRHHPQRALERADTALWFSGESLDARVIQAAAQAALRRPAAAQKALEAGTRAEPRNHVPWALLGDLATRRGDVDAARGHYRRAAQLNPRDLELARAAKRAG